MKTNQLFRLIVFYLAAIILSNIFRFDLFHIQPYLESLPVWLMIFYGPLQAIGVLTGALVALHWLSKERETDITLFGTSKKWSIAMGILPILLLLVVGVNNNRGIESHYFGLVAGISTLIYCFFEEIGWRGYLEQELRDRSEFVRVLLIALLWYLWHLKFLNNPDPLQNIQLLGWLLLGSWGLGKIVHLTKSILAAACFHMGINIVMFNGFIREGLSSAGKAIILGTLFSIWILILVIWQKEKTAAGSKGNS